MGAPRQFSKIPCAGAKSTPAKCECHPDYSCQSDGSNGKWCYIKNPDSCPFKYDSEKASGWKSSGGFPKWFSYRACKEGQTTPTPTDAPSRPPTSSTAAPTAKPTQAPTTAKPTDASPTELPPSSTAVPTAIPTDAPPSGSAPSEAELTFEEDACVPKLGASKHAKCSFRGYLVSSFNHTYVVLKDGKPYLVEHITTKEYCGRCTWPYYGRWCQRRRSDKTTIDLAVIVDSTLDLTQELKTYVSDLKVQGVTAEVFTWDLPATYIARTSREMRRLLLADFKSRGLKSVFIVGHVPAVRAFVNVAERNITRGTLKNVILGYYMFLNTKFSMPADMCSTPGGFFEWPGSIYQQVSDNPRRFENLPGRKISDPKDYLVMDVSLGILNHLTVDEYKAYFDKLHRWRKGGNKFFDVGSGTSNKPLLLYKDIARESDAQPTTCIFGMGEDFKYPQDVDLWRSGNSRGRCFQGDDPDAGFAPSKDCAVFKDCEFERGDRSQAFFKSGYGFKPSVTEQDDDHGTKYVIARWMIHGNTLSTECFTGADLHGQPFVGASIFFMHSCSSSSVYKPNLGSTVTSMKYGLNSLGNGCNGAPQHPWIFTDALRMGKTTGEAFKSWWSSPDRHNHDGFGQHSIVMYGDPMLIYGVLSKWEKDRPRAPPRCTWGEKIAARIRRKNVMRILGKTLEECKDLCDKESRCKAIVFEEAGLCDLKFCRIGEADCAKIDDEQFTYMTCTETSPSATSEDKMDFDKEMKEEIEIADREDEEAADGDDTEADRKDFEHDDKLDENSFFEENQDEDEDEDEDEEEDEDGNESEELKGEA